VMNKRVTIRLMTARAVCLCLISMTLSFVPAPTSQASPESIAYLDDADIDQGAGQFDEAAREIRGILNLDLNTEQGVKAAAAILKRNERTLVQVEKKALHAAMGVASFKKGLRDEAAKRKGGAEELAKELEANHDLIGTLPGAQEAAEAIKASTRPAAETLQRVSEALKKAADDASSKNKPVKNHADAKVERATEAQGFCGSYQYVCDLLTRLGLYYLRRSLSNVQMTERKVSCVLSSYAAYGSCAATHWWELAACTSRLSSAISNCILYA